jgi:hypothetical protein
MSHTAIITSAAYANDELCAELGRLPASFLPLGNRRLFEAQVEALAPLCDTVVLTLPQSFTPDPEDTQWLADHNVTVITVPDDKTLSDSLLYCLNVLPQAPSQLTVLHGDTLLGDMAAFSANSLALTHHPSAGYSWGAVDLSLPQAPFQPAGDIEGDMAIIAGYFCFNQPALLVRCLTQANGRFLAALNAYHAHNPLVMSETKAWLDFGHVTLYYQSKNAVQTHRSFNDVSYNKRTLTKTGTHHAKIRAEALWYQQLPAELKAYLPNVTAIELPSDATPPSYTMEYLYYPLLANLFVFGRNQKVVWQTIFNSLNEFMTLCQKHAQPPTNSDFSTEVFYKQKTLQRLADYARTTGLDLDQPWVMNGTPLPSIKVIVDTCVQAIPELTHTTVSHGDLCFSNIFYDFRSECIRVIDPRGMTLAGDPTIMGDPRYDLAKLSHSLIGGYDHMIAGRATLVDNGYDLTLSLGFTPQTLAVQALFKTMRFGELSPNDAAIQAITILLFLSMLPLHADRPDRQRLFLANALRLFNEWQTKQPFVSRTLLAGASH